MINEVASRRRKKNEELKNGLNRRKSSKESITTKKIYKNRSTEKDMNEVSNPIERGTMMQMNLVKTIKTENSI